MVAHLDGARFNYAGAAPPKHLQPLKALLTMEPGPFADPGAMKSRFTVSCLQLFVDHTFFQH